MLRIELVKSPIGNTIRNRRTVAALGLRKVHQVVEHPDNPSIRGMIHHVKHLLKFEVAEGEKAPKSKPESKKPAKPDRPDQTDQSRPEPEKPKKAAAKPKAASAAKPAPKKKAEAK